MTRKEIEVLCAQVESPLPWALDAVERLIELVPHDDECASHTNHLVVEVVGRDIFVPNDCDCPRDARIKRAIEGDKC